MALTITVSTPSGTPAPTTPGGKACVEVGSQVTLTASGGSGSFKWGEDSGGTLLTSKPEAVARAWVVTGRAFGLVKIAVKATSGDFETLNLYVGSVVIVGADNNHWQVFADGTTKPHVEVDSRVKSMVDCNAVVADITGIASTTPSPGTPPSEAVTCYVLNLKSFALDKTKKP
ncbi:hypothetical protein [Pyxidicoccus trucidator]|uniref:hypothetical protein n=1 Tax=Pyxidicoccus trucidator TaxID=2709662 RepID=UPI0013DC6E0F|nr:hypothetical protein [Pyxidicoccus trucidator]